MEKTKKFEIVEFYPVVKRENYKGNENFLGTLHIFLSDFGMDIKGINVILSRKGLLYFMPGRQAFDEKKQKNVFYPYVNFSNKDFSKELLNFLKKEGTAYIWNKNKKLIQEKRKDDRDYKLQASA